MDIVVNANLSGLKSVSEPLEVEGHGNVAYQRETQPNNAFTEASSSNNDYVSQINVEALGESVEAKGTEEEDIQFEAQLPQGLNINSISGIEIPYEEAGNIFQFLEFYSTFGNVLGLKEGQAISIVHELFSSGHRKRKQYSSVIWMMIHLLNLISKDRNMNESLSLSKTNDSWFSAIGNVLLKSGVLNDDFPPDIFEGGVAKYMEINASERLKLLLLLCDEALNTNAMRKYIKNEIKDFIAKNKKAKQKAAAANEREKQLKKTIRSDLVQAHMENTGAYLSNEEHRTIMSQLRTQAKEANAEKLEAKEMASKDLLSLNVVRTAPIMSDGKGLVLWKLNCYKEEPKFLLQDVGTFVQLCPHEKWLTFKAEQKQDIETFIDLYQEFCRMKLMQKQKQKKKRTQKKRRTKKTENAVASELAPNHNIGVVISEPS